MAMARLERGRLLDRLGRYDEAWRDLRRGQAPARGRGRRPHVQRRRRSQRSIARLKLLRPRECRTAAAGAAARRAPQPIFIMGVSALGHDADRAGARESPGGARGRRALVHQRAAAVLAAAVRADRNHFRRTWRAPGLRITAGPPHCFATTTRARRAVRAARARQALLHRQDAVQRDLAAAAAHGVSRRRRSSACCAIRWTCACPCSPTTCRTASTAAIGSKTSCIICWRYPIWTRTTRASCSGRAQAALRALRGGATEARRCGSSIISAWALRAGMPELPRESALRADAELCAGDAAAQRPLHRPPPPLRTAVTAFPVAAAAPRRSEGLLKLPAQNLRRTPP